jgi:putative ABC transport system permease protein
VASITLVTVVIATFSYLQAVTESAIRTMVGTGDPNTVIVLNRMAETETMSGVRKDSVDKLQLVPGVIRGENGPVISQEMVEISSAYTLESPDVSVNAAVRGVDFEMANLVRHDRVKIIEGRTFEPGRAEVIVGESVRQVYKDHDIGDRIQLGNRGLREFEIVGIFSTDGTSADSEIWGYVESLRDVYNRNAYSSVRLNVANALAGQEAVAYITGPGVELTAMTEEAYFKRINTGQAATRILSVAMIVILGIASIFAMANTMYSAVAGRSAEIGMLRAIGFGRITILTCFVLEGIFIAGMGGVVGCALANICNGWRESILPTTFTTVTYTIQVTPLIMAVSMAISIAIGFLGSLMPAWHASRMNVVGALRDA